MKIREKFLSMSEPDWVRKMKARYAETGCYPAEELRRLFGEPNKRVEVGRQRSLVDTFLKGS